MDTRHWRGLASASFLAVLVPLAVAAPALAAPGPAAGHIWYVAPGGAASAPCGHTKATACGSVNVAIGEASPGGTIKIAAGTYTAATTAGLVVVAKNLTVTGAGAASTVLNGNHLGTAVTVDPGVAATVTGVTIEGGTGTAMSIEDTPSLAGGGVLNQGTLTLGHDTLTGNGITAAATGTNSVLALGGGAFNADGGALTVSHSVISGNSLSVSASGSGEAVAIGAGVTSDATAESPEAQTSVSYTTIHGNTATATVTGAGGSGAGEVVGAGVGELWSAGQPDLAHDTVTGNTALATAGANAGGSGVTGGGVGEVDSDTADAVSESTISGNKATSQAAGAGAATTAAAGLFTASSNNGHAVEGSVVHGNNAAATVTGSGDAEIESAGVDVVASADADAITGSTISGNTATVRSSGSGGAAAVGAGVGGAGSDTANAISQSTIDDNTTKAVNTGTGNAGVGGAIGALISPIITSTIDGNQANATASSTNPSGPVQVNAIGGGLTVATNDETGSAASPVNADTFAGNKAIATYTGGGAGLPQAAGGGIGGSTSVTNSTVNNNSALAVGSGTGVEVTGFGQASQGLRRLGASDSPLAGLAALTVHAPHPAAASTTGPDHLAAVAGSARLPRLAATVQGQIWATETLLIPARPNAAASPRRSDAAEILASAITGGGGIGTMTGPISNTTVFQNVANSNSTGAGEALAQGGGVGLGSSLVNSTIAINQATAGGVSGGMVQGGGVGTSTPITNAIVAGNSPTDCGAATSADGGGNLDTDGTCGLSAANGSVSAGYAGLGPLASNGGPTQTLALTTGSQAISLGLAAACETVTGPGGAADADQRGDARNNPARGTCDSGAYDTGGTP
ncbi:MAG TPA: choice-of-anchor Q domain-containing protein [Streptosporangiaceae bacterium]|nr:choice-of-anchor Q domain-containing protein [Streptosporangiaceae bacterium]